MADAPAPELPLTGGAPVMAEAVVAPAAAVPSEQPTAATEAPKLELASDTPTLLETFEKKEDPKPAEAKPEEKPTEKPAEAAKPEPAKEAAKPEAEKPAEPAQPEPLPPVEYKYTLPETLKMDEAIKGELHTALDAFRANPGEGVQSLIDLHNKTMQTYAEETLRNQHKVFSDTRAGWRKDVLADEEIGGSGHQTAMRAIARMRDLAVPEKDRASFDEFLRITGAGDHPAFLKAMHNFARYFDEPSLPPPNPKPPTGNGQAPGRRGRVLYDKTNSNGRQ